MPSGSHGGGGGSHGGGFGGGSHFGLGSSIVSRRRAPIRIWFFGHHYYVPVNKTRNILKNGSQHLFFF